MKRAEVLGAGAWGTGLAKVLADKGERVTLFTRRPELPGLIAQARCNERYLPGVELGGDLVVTTDLGEALSEGGKAYPRRFTALAEAPPGRCNRFRSKSFQIGWRRR